MTTPNASADQPLRRQKIRDRAFVLPLVGLALLVPPVAGVFQLPGRIAGVPFALLYLFAVWAVLIACGAVLARELRLYLEGTADGERSSAASGEDAEA